LLDLTSVRQNRDESVLNYFQSFKAIKNRCFNLSLFEIRLSGFSLQQFAFLLEGEN